MTPQLEPWVGRATVAQHLCVSVKTVDRLVRQGLPSVKCGGLRRFRLSEVDAWVQGQ